MKDLLQMLYDKANAEQKAYIEKLKIMPPDVIIQSAYEKVIRDDILSVFEGSELPINHVKELLKQPFPLSACYDEWLSNDYSHMQDIRDTVSELAESLIQHRKEQNKKEPER